MKSRLQTVAMLMAAMTAGFIGGQLGHGRQAEAQGGAVPQVPVVTAREVRVVDDAGRVRMRMGEDKGVYTVTTLDVAGKAVATWPAPQSVLLPPGTVTPGATTPALPAGVEMSAVTWLDEGYGMRSLAGSLQNNTGKPMKWVLLYFSLYDRDGALVGDAVASINIVEQGALWKFRAPVTKKEAVTFKLQKVTSM